MNHIEGFYHNADLIRFFSLGKNFFKNTNEKKLKAEIRLLGSSLFVKPPKYVRKLINSGNYVAMPVRTADKAEFDEFYQLTDKTTIGFFKVRG